MTCMAAVPWPIAETKANGLSVVSHCK